MTAFQAADAGSTPVIPSIRYPASPLWCWHGSSARSHPATASSGDTAGPLPRRVVQQGCAPPGSTPDIREGGLSTGLHASLAQWQSSGLLIREVRVRVPGEVLRASGQLADRAGPNPVNVRVQIPPRLRKPDDKAVLRILVRSPLREEQVRQWRVSKEPSQQWSMA